MATITTDTYLDDGTARTSGEVMTINGGVLTIRTDTRWHVGSPASMTGTLGSPSISATLGGGLTIDARNVRWLAYDTGSGNVPAIGTSITQGGVSGYLLAVYDTLTSAPTAVGAAMPANGFIKFREVTAGPFASGALTGIGANATGADVTGWLEVVLNQSALVTTRRVGSGFVTRGDWFYLDDTTGSIGQTLQVPTNGGGAHCPGVWVETAVASDEYEFWPALNGDFTLQGATVAARSGNGWINQALGAAEGATDFRQNFVRLGGNGTMVFGETFTQASTYASVTDAATYTTTAQSSTYTWVGNVVKVTMAAHGHYVGEQVYADFTTGGATANDGLYTITAVTGPNTYEFALTGSGASGNCSVIKVISVTFTGHGLSAGEDVYLDFTSGAGVDGVYTVYSVTSANVYTVLSPQAATSGNVSTVARITVTFTSHGMLAGTDVYCDFTSGTGVDGVYEIRDQRTAVTANAYSIAAAIAPGATGNVTVRKTIGNVPVAGCKTRIPNVFLRQSAATDTSTYAVVSNTCTITETAHGHQAGDMIYHDFTTGTAPDGLYTILTVPTANSYTFACVTGDTSGNVTRKGGRAYNMPPHATVTTRPSFTTIDAGVIDMEYAYCDWYILAGQPYTFKLQHSAFFDTIYIAECATEVILNNVGTGMHNSLDVRALQLTTNLNGATITDCTFMRGNVPGSADHAVDIATCQNVNVTRLRAGLTQHHVRSSGYGVQVTNSSGVTFTDTELHGTGAQVTTSTNVTFTDTYYCDHLIGKTTVLVPVYVITVATKAADVLVDGIHFGKSLKYATELIRNGPYSGIMSVTACDRIRLRNAGTRAAPLNPLSEQGFGIAAIGNAMVSGGINSDVKVQNTFLGQQRVASPITTVNSDKNITIENVHGRLLQSRLATTYTNAALNATEKAIGAGTNTVAANASVYGSHFHDAFNRDEYGRIVLVMNEATDETADVVSVVAGTPKFTSAPGCAMAAVNDEVIFTMPHYVYGHTGFLLGTVTFPTVTGTGGTGNHDFFYKIDKNDGNGFNASWRNLSYKRLTGSGTSGLFTLTMTSTTGVNVDDYVSGSGVGVNAKVVSIDNATQITVNVANASTFSGTLFFNQLPNEVIDPADGFKLSIRVITTVAATTNVNTYLSIDTTTTLAAQEAISYPLDPVTTALTLTNLPTGTEVHVYRESDGAQLAVEESTAGSTFTYDYTWVGTDVDVYITVLKIGYQFKRYDNQTLGSTGKDIEVFLTLDRNYRNP